MASRRAIVHKQYLLPSSTFITIWVPKWCQFVGGQLHLWICLQIHISVLPFAGPVHVQFQSHICLTFDEGENSISGLTSVQPKLMGEWSTTSPDASLYSYLCSTFWWSTPSPVPIPYISYHTWRGGSPPSSDPYLCSIF